MIEIIIDETISATAENAISAVIMALVIFSKHPIIVCSMSVHLMERFSLFPLVFTQVYVPFSLLTVSYYC